MSVFKPKEGNQEKIRMLGPSCPLTKKEKLYVILHHECFNHTLPSCFTDCTFFKKRVLKIQNFTTEIQTDLKKLHCLNIEEELVKILAEEIRREIDIEILKKC